MNKETRGRTKRYSINPKIYKMKNKSCKNCGTKGEEPYNFCVECGEKFIAEDNSSVQKTDKTTDKQIGCGEQFNQWKCGINYLCSECSLKQISKTNFNSLNKISRGLK